MPENPNHSLIAEAIAAVERDPDNYAPYYELGRLYYQLEDYDQAMTTYRKGVAIDILNTSRYVFKWADNRTQYLNAIDTFQSALRINPHDAAVHIDIGEMFCNLLRYEEAIAP